MDKPIVARFILNVLICTYVNIFNSDVWISVCFTQIGVLKTVDISQAALASYNYYFNEENDHDFDNRSYWIVLKIKVNS